MDDAALSRCSATDSGACRRPAGTALSAVMARTPPRPSPPRALAVTAAAARVAETHGLAEPGRPALSMTALARPAGGLTLGAFAGVAALLGAAALVVQPSPPSSRARRVEEPALAATLRLARARATRFRRTTSRSTGRPAAAYARPLARAGRDRRDRVRPRPLTRPRRAVRRQRLRLLRRPDAVQPRATARPRPGRPTASTATTTATRDPYDPADAIPSAARYLRALLDAPHGDIATPSTATTTPRAYVDDVLARARAYSRPTRRRARSTAPRAALRRATRRAHRPGQPASAERRDAPARLRDAAGVGDGRRPRRPADRRAPARRRAVDAAHATGCASPPRAKAATTRTATAPRSTSSPPTGRPGRLGRLGRRARARPRLDARVRALRRRARPARSCQRSSSSATRATPATARRARAPAAAPPTCTSPGCPAATDQQRS